MRSADNINTLIIGAGTAGELLSKEIISDPNTLYKVVGFIDDEKDSIQRVNDIPVVGTFEELNECVKNLEIHELIIAIPSHRGEVIRGIISETIGLKLSYKILPNNSEVLLQDFKESYTKFIRHVRPEDLLGGEILKSDQENIREHAAGQTIMISGAAGSIGSELSRQIASLQPSLVVFYDWWENGIFELKNELLEIHPEGKFEFVIGDVKDVKRLDSVVERYKPSTIFHAAAYKHVPLMEGNSVEAVKNNIIGTKTIAEVAIKHNVAKFILVSTDKAVNPTNVMGATKRAAEKIIHILANSQDVTKLYAVRFGNVINSNGSAIPFFEKQIAKGGPVTVTHEDITRYFMTIPEAVHLILQAWIMGKNDDLFVLEMGEPVKIYDLAKWLITLNGYTLDEVKIIITGLRPGEKLYEEVLVTEETTQATSVKKIHRTKNYMNFDKANFSNNLNQLVASINASQDSDEYIRQSLKSMISTYKPKNHSIKGD